MSENLTRPAREPASIRCPHCIEVIGRFDHFCPHCNGPVTGHASTDPMGQVYSLGRVYSKAASGPPSRIVVIGIWLLLAPQVLLLTGSLIRWGSYFLVPSQRLHILNGNVVFTHERSVLTFSAVAGFVLLAGLNAVYLSLLWKITRRYRSA